MVHDALKHIFHDPAWTEDGLAWTDPSERGLDVDGRGLTVDGCGLDLLITSA